jgi:hypothetical protein
MKNKHWLAALIIICLLAFAFFWGGNNQRSYTGAEEESTGTCAVKSTAASQAEKVRQKQETQDRIAVENSEDSEKASTPETEAPKELLPDEANKTGKSSKTANIKEELSKKSSVNDSAKSVKDKTEAGISKAKGNKDKYLTDPVPDGKPKPVEWQETQVSKNKKLTCTLSVTCRTILANMDEFNKDKLEVLPEDGIIYKARKVTFYAGESVFDVLLREMKNNKIHMEFEMTPIYNSNYIEGIHNLYEFDCGELSGWMYKVNGWFPNYGCSRYMLKDGDTVEWIYTCDLGRDIGGGTAAGGKGQ